MDVGAGDDGHEREAAGCGGGVGVDCYVGGVVSFPSFLLGFCDGGLGGEWLADYGLMQVDLLRADARERGFPDRDAGGGYQPCHTRGERAEEGQGAILCLSAIHKCQIHVESRLDRHWTGTGDILWRCYSGAPSVASEKAI